jgi:hypothetical protein
MSLARLKPVLFAALVSACGGSEAATSDPGGPDAPSGADARIADAGSDVADGRSTMVDAGSMDAAIADAPNVDAPTIDAANVDATTLDATKGAGDAGVDASAADSASFDGPNPYDASYAACDGGILDAAAFPCTLDVTLSGGLSTPSGWNGCGSGIVGVRLSTGTLSIFKRTQIRASRSFSTARCPSTRSVPCP